MDILAKLPRPLKAQIFLFMRHPVAEIYRPVCLHPAWYRDAVKLIDIIECLEQSVLCEDCDSMRELLITFQARRTLELPPQVEGRLRAQARMYKRMYEARRGPLEILDII